MNPSHWIYHLINKGCIQVSKDADTGLYLFPDKPETLTAFRQLKEDTVNNLRFS